MNDEQDRKMRQALASLEINGAATLRVNDGQIFFFSKKKMVELLAELEKTGEEKVVIFVKTQPEKPDAGGN
jgi:hypothetical protein